MAGTCQEYSFSFLPVEPLTIPKCYGMPINQSEPTCANRSLHINGHFGYKWQIILYISINHLLINLSFTVIVHVRPMIENHYIGIYNAFERGCRGITKSMYVIVHHAAHKQETHRCNFCSCCLCSCMRVKMLHVNDGLLLILVLSLRTNMFVCKIVKLDKNCNEAASF